MIGVYDYTVILTYLSLLSACAGMIVSMSGMGHPYYGMFFMLFSGLCDAFDGRVARTKKNRSRMEQDFGVQIDSFSDLIAFGILPASIGVSLLRVSEKYSDVPRRLAESGKVLWYPAVLVGIALFYVLAAMIRLAYFNVTVEDRKRELAETGREYFTGMPVTTAALVFPLVLVLHYFLRFDLSIIYFVVMLAMAFLFVGNFKVPKPGKKTLGVLVAVGLVELVMFVVIKILAAHR